MKTKIYILLALLLSLSGIQELNAQDTLWTKVFEQSKSGVFTKDGTKVLYTFYPNDLGLTLQLCTADSGLVLWSDDSLKNHSIIIAPDSISFLSYGVTDSGSEYIAIRRLSDGTVMQQFDTIFTNANPKPIPFRWKLDNSVFSNNSKYLFVSTTDRNAFTPNDATIHNYIYKIDLLTGQLVYLRLDSNINYFVMKPDEDKLICWNNNGIAFYDTDSLKEQKSYRDGGIFRISRSGRYISNFHGDDSLITWDSQRDSIVKRNHLDSLDLWSFRYTQNDSIVIISALPINLWQWELVFYNVLSGQKIKEMLMHYTLNEVLLTPVSFEVSPDGSKLLVKGNEGIYMFPLSLNPITHKEDNPPESIIRVNPNPALGNVVIQLDSQTYYDAKISLYDENGGFVMNIKEENFNSEMNTITFSTKNLSNGIYFIRVAGSRVIQSSKLIINK